MWSPTVLGLLLCATPASPLEDPTTAVNQRLAPEWVRPAPVAEVKVNDEARVRRFVGALESMRRVCHSRG